MDDVLDLISTARFLDGRVCALEDVAALIEGGSHDPARLVAVLTNIAATERATAAILRAGPFVPKKGGRFIDGPPGDDVDGTVICTYVPELAARLHTRDLGQPWSADALAASSHVEVRRLL